MGNDRTITMEEFNDSSPDPIRAGITNAKYDALVSEGFTPQQAIYLCKEGKNG